MAQQDQGRVYGIGQQYDNTPLDLPITNLGAVRIDQGAPRYFEMSRRGWLFGVTHTLASGIAPLQTIPTTTAAFVLNNVDTNNYVIVPLLIGLTLGSGTAGLGTSLLVTNSPAALATQLTAQGTGVVHANLRGSDNTPTAYADFGKTLPGTPVWNNVGGMQNAAAAVVGSGFTVDLQGMYVVKPTYALGVTVISGAGTSPLFTVSIIYARIPSLTP